MALNVDVAVYRIAFVEISYIYLREQWDVFSNKTTYDNLENLDCGIMCSYANSYDVELSARFRFKKG